MNRLKLDLVPSDNNEVEYLRTAAIELQYAEQWSEALSALQAWAAIDEDNGEVYYRLGFVQGHVGDRDACIRSLQKSIYLYPMCADAYFLLGRQYHALRRLDPAELAFAAAVALDANHWRAWLGFGSVLSLRGENMLARRAFDHGISINPKDAGLRYRAGHASEVGGDFFNAVRHYREALRLDAGNLQVAYRLTALFWQIGDFGSVESLCRQTVERFPNEPRANLNMGSILFIARKYDEGRQFWTKAAKSNDREVSSTAKRYLKQKLRSDVDQANLRPGISLDDDTIDI